MSHEPKKILIMAGGTGGHVIPALSIAKVLKAKGYEVHWLGTTYGIEHQLVPKADIPIHYISIRGLRGKGRAGLIVAPFKLLRAFYQSLSVMKKVEPICVISMGGYVAGPGGLAAFSRWIPLVVHEQNSIPGLTNKILAKLAKRIMTAYPDTLPSKKTVYTGNPIREYLQNVAHPAKRMSKDGKLKVLVIGGSLGAKALNEAVPESVAKLDANKRPEIWHQTGKQGFKQVEKAYQDHHIEAKVSPFIEDMKAAYLWADLVICRAGALTLSELAAVGMASILVPFPHAVDDHQTQNAKFLSEQGAAILLPQSELTPEKLKHFIIEFMDNESKRLTMAEKARQLAKCEATDLVVNHCLEVCRG